MKQQKHKDRVKDDKDILEITQQWKQERQRLKLREKPHDFKSATAFWQSWQESENVKETKAQEVIEIFASVKENQLVFKEPAPFPVHNNEIYIGERKIIITLEDSSSAHDS